MKFRCPYCGYEFEDVPLAKCPRCGKVMQIPAAYRNVSARERKKAKERIQREGDRELRKLSGFRVGPGRSPGTVAMVLVVMIIVGGMLIGRVNQTMPKSKKKQKDPVATAQKEVGVLSMALEQFKTDCGRYPTVEEGIHALLARVEVEGWDGPYVTLIKPDPWGNHYVYAVTNNHATVMSFGPDRQAGTQDDISR